MRRSDAKLLIGGTAAVFVAGMAVTQPETVKQYLSPVVRNEGDQARERSVYFSGCDAARAAGVAPIHAGQPGYRETMDGDGDGIACEPYYGR